MQYPLGLGVAPDVYMQPPPPEHKSAQKPDTIADPSAFGTPMQMPEQVLVSAVASHGVPTGSPVGAVLVHSPLRGLQKSPGTPSKSARHCGTQNGAGAAAFSAARS